MLLNVIFSQIESGMSEPILEHPGIQIRYLTPTWITSIRQLIFQHNLTISLTDTFTVLLRGPKDKCLMNRDALSWYSTQQQHDINLVRLYLQIIMLSDMSQPDGISACCYHLKGTRRPAQVIRIKTWPRQEPPTAPQVRLWTHTFQKIFCDIQINGKILWDKSDTKILQQTIQTLTTCQSKVTSNPYHSGIVDSYTNTNKWQTT